MADAGRATADAVIDWLEQQRATVADDAATIKRRLHDVPSNHA